MKTIKYLLIALLVSLTLISCSSEDSDPILVTEDPLSEYTMLTSMTANNHRIEIYSEQNQFTVGYNELFVRIKDNATEEYVSNAELTWKPVMHMTQMMHSCPASNIVKTDNASVYKGYAIFQMAGNTEEYWELSFDYVIKGQSYTSTERIEVKLPVDGKQRVASFMGTDNVRYILAMMPFEPLVAVNDLSAILYKMEDMMTFSIVENYKVTLDPRMPGMGNHSSPNNVDLSYNASSKDYNGKLSLTMTGYWKLNLTLQNQDGETLKGEDVTEENEASSLYFELEF